jgi:hypothetical protein
MYKIIKIDFELFVQEKHVSHKTHRCSLGKLDDKKNHIKISKAWNFEPNNRKGKRKIIKISYITNLPRPCIYAFTTL